MSHAVAFASNLIPTRDPALMVRLRDKARKARDLALVGLAWGGSWGVVVGTVYGFSQAF